MNLYSFNIQLPRNRYSQAMLHNCIPVNLEIFVQNRLEVFSGRYLAGHFRD